MATESEDDGDGAIYTRSLRARLFGGGASRSREKLKGITTAPGKQCAGETETEADEPPRHLPTARIIPPSAPLVPPNTLQERLTPLLFESSRLLSVVPAVFGTLYNIYHVYNPPIPPSPHSSSSAACSSTPHRIDYLVSALWAILTGYQCLALTTGLLARWRLYYPPLPTLIRLLALQAICWPATHLTLGVLRHEVRPAVCWAVVGTTTCVSRSVQLWVTSNLWWERRPSEGGRPSDSSGKGSGGGAKGEGGGERERRSRGWRRWGGGKWGGRRWDWGEVCAKCALPAGVVYFVMAWAEALRREWVGC
ncbi:hypothetical protein PLICRDRAFT_117249 [Plicaturopsis crispa FD-325 SS-3]|uniref:N-glycosylation protein EOS1 n=1 Tax=Plicaturopsis crispa FD-325 SS-3 TaxID=944288 RepID=A0A0C9SL40_PLICR|nr:hypothetical protein PLICRDRAFT_117249 [Plicaturopsis crispa FD-325 SS-3]